MRFIMTNEKKQIITIYIDKMNIGKSNQNLVMRATQEKEPSKNCEKVIDYAYKLALLIETKALSPKRERKMCLNLVSACENYNDELQIFIDYSR